MEENLYYKDHIRTYTGKYINPINPDVSRICIEDIAHALSQMPRFNGHLKSFYSVAQHCLGMVDQCKYDSLDKAKMIRTILLHDSTEAYLLDLPKPIKQGIPQYKEIEDYLHKVIADKFSLFYPLPTYVKYLDEKALEWEWNNLMLGEADYPVADMKVIERRFLNVFHKYSV